MQKINEDKSIYVTRGDAIAFDVTATEDGVRYKFKAGDVLRFKVAEKKGCDCVMLQKDFPVEAETDKVQVWLTGEEMKFGDVISKPKDYWYEVELNPETVPQTIIGYDEDGPKIMKLFPEGKDVRE